MCRRLTPMCRRLAPAARGGLRLLAPSRPAEPPLTAAIPSLGAGNAPCQGPATPGTPLPAWGAVRKERACTCRPPRCRCSPGPAAEGTGCAGAFPWGLPTPMPTRAQGLGGGGLGFPQGARGWLVKPGGGGSRSPLSPVRWVSCGPLAASPSTGAIPSHWGLSPHRGDGAQGGTEGSRRAGTLQGGLSWLRLCWGLRERPVAAPVPCRACGDTSLGLEMH